MAPVNRSGSSAGNQEFHLDLPLGQQESKDLSHILLLFQFHEQGGGWEVKQVGFEFTPICYACMTTVALLTVHSAVMDIPSF